MLCDDLSSLQDLLEDMSPDDWEQVMDDVMEPFDLHTFVSLTPDDICDVIEDMPQNEWEQFMENVLDSFDLDDFVL